MTRVRTSLVVVGLVVALAGLNAVPARAQSSGETPKATEIGVTPTEIHIAVVADVDNPFVPGLFQGIVDGVRAGAKYLNSKEGGGGLAGRKVVVDFLDSKLNPNEARNGVITACQNDFALVGTSALFLSTVDDMVGCKDQAGAATGVPDVAAIVTGVPESCSPVTFPVNPPQLVCSTKDQHPQTYYGNQGDAKYLLKTHKHDLHGALLVSNDTKDAQRGATAIIDTASNAGIKADQKPVLSGRDPQSAYTPVVNQMKSDGSNYSLTTMALSNAVELRSEAQLQGLTDPDFVWECTTCYDKAIADHADVMNGTYMTLGYLPFEEASIEPDAGQLREVRGQGQGQRLLGVRLDLYARVRRRGECRGQEHGRERPHPRQPPGVAEGTQRLQRRRDDRHGEHRPEDPQLLLPARAVRGQEVRAHLPEEGGHFRLRGVEPSEDQSRSHRLIGSCGRLPRTTESVRRQSEGRMPSSASSEGAK